MRYTVPQLIGDTNLLWKDSLNSDDHQFHQYQQNEQLPLNSNH